MDDRELLELAAKAAGIEVVHFYDGLHDVTSDPNKIGKPWKPLVDDGDALRLASELNINITFSGCGPGNYRGSWTVVASPQIEEPTTYGQELTWSGISIAEKYKRPQERDQEFDNRPIDKMVAVRRAIVSAAAEIGKQMDAPLVRTVEG